MAPGFLSPRPALDIWLYDIPNSVLSERFNDINQVDVEGMDLSNVEVYREWNNIDILIKLENIVVCIENKILSGEHSNQLTKYKKVVENLCPQSHGPVYAYEN